MNNGIKFTAIQIFLTFIILIVLLAFSSCSQSKAEQDPGWLQQMRADNLALSESQVIAIESNSDLYPADKRNISNRYEKIKRILQTQREALANGFNELRGDLRVKRMEDALYTIETAATQVLFPLWAGGKWSMEGTARVPQTGEIACGYYIQRIMEALDFNICSRPGILMGQVATDEQVWSYSGIYSENLKSYEGLKSYAEKEGPGLYIVGMSADWGHVLFMRYKPGERLRFHHAGPTPGGAKVTYDDVEEYITEFQQPYLIHATKIDLFFAERWLNKSEIYPIKVRRYHWETEPAPRMTQAQPPLKRLGYYTGALDYTFGPQTRVALRDFQRDNNLRVTGLPDDPTLECLKKQPVSAQNTPDQNSRVRNARTNCGEIVAARFRDSGFEYPPAAIFIRIFKQEKQVELWAGDSASEKHKLVYTWRFTDFSGTLGPKRTQGDYQIPEGVYFIDRFNPWSNYHLSLGLNYPNKSDRIMATGRNPGGDIFIHGSYVTIGCVPIGDRHIEELYIIALDAKSNGQTKIPVHIFPCRMEIPEAQEMMKQFSEGKPELIEFWANLRLINDAFQNSKLVPSIGINDSGKYSVLH